MKAVSFIKGVGVGIAVGAAAGMLVMVPMPMKKRGCKTVAGCAARALGDAMNDVADCIEI